MFRLSRLRVCLGAGALAAAGLVALAVGFAAASALAPSLSEYVGVICSAFQPAAPAEAEFLSENISVMAKMMAGMQAAPTGDVDRDFVEMMVSHHQGAIDMAAAVLHYGRNERIRRLAQEIIVTQQQEIAAMRLAVGEPLPDPSSIAPSKRALGVAARRQGALHGEPGANE
jgi:Domain of unknown function (DUF305)